MNLEILQQFIADNKSTYDISSITGKSQTTIRYWLKKYNLKTNYIESIVTNTHKKCAKCNEIKMHDEFYGEFTTKTIHNLSSYCKICSNKGVVQRQQAFKQKCISYKGSKCIICNYDKYQGALEFHHIDPQEKDFNIADHNTVFNDQIKLELDKCILVCANCHREIHGGLVAAIGLEPTSLSV